MASCEYGQIAGGTCGSSVDNPENVKSVVLAKCTKAIQGHLRSCNIRDASLDSELKLLLARAGTYIKKNRCETKTKCNLAASWSDSDCFYILKGVRKFIEASLVFVRLQPVDFNYCP